MPFGKRACAHAARMCSTSAREGFATGSFLYSHQGPLSSDYDISALVKTPTLLQIETWPRCFVMRVNDQCSRVNASMHR